MARPPKTPMGDDWITFKRADNGRNFMVHAEDIFAVHEGAEPGTILIEYLPHHERASDVALMSFKRFTESYARGWTAIGRRAPKKKPAEAGSKVLAFKQPI